MVLQVEGYDAVPVLHSGKARQYSKILKGFKVFGRACWNAGVALWLWIKKTQAV
jgi:hypothetical protein